MLFNFWREEFKQNTFVEIIFHHFFWFSTLVNIDFFS